MIVDLLYRLERHDVQSRLLDPFIRSASVSLANAVVEAAIAAVPVDQVLLLQGLRMAADPGAAQNVNAMILRLSPAVGTSNDIKRNSAALAVNISGDLNWEGQFLVPSLTIISALAIFNAGAVANIVDLDVFGVLLPRGNVERL